MKRNTSNIKKKTFVVVVLVAQLLTGCSGGQLYQLVTKPYTMNTKPPAGPANYQLGWLDGCESGIASNNTDLQMTLGTYRLKVRSQLHADKLYNTAWRYAYDHCGFSMRALNRYSL